MAFPEFSARKLRYHLHSKNVKHGIEIDLIPLDTKLLIVPDASSGEFEIHKELHDKGIEVLVLDHHPAEQLSEHAIVVNPVLSDSYPTNNMSGAGVVMKFIEQIDKNRGTDFANNFQDLVAFGTVGDAISMADKEARSMVNAGLNNMKNNFLKELAKVLDDGVELSPNTLSFKLLPQLNSLLRVGTQEEKEELMLALLQHREVTVNPKLRKANKNEEWHERVARICRNAYGRQRRLREKIVEELSAKVEAGDMTKNRFMVLEIEGDFEMNMSGYIASNLVNRYRKPVLILRKDEDTELLVGSARGYDQLLTDTKAHLQSLNLFETAEGHAQAFGLKITPDNFKKLNEAINQSLYELDVDESYMVDLIMNANSLTKNFIFDMSKYDKLWGKGLEQPLYAVEQLEVNLGDAEVIGKEQNIIKFNLNGIEFIKFNDNESLLDLRLDNKTAILNVVGKTGLNSWKGNVTPQFVIEAVQVVEVKDTARFVF